MHTDPSSDGAEQIQGMAGATHWDIVVDPAQQLAVITARGGTGTLNLLRVFAQQLVQTSHWAPGYDVVWDMIGLSSVIVAPEDLPGILNVPADFNFGGGRSAFVVDHEDYYPLAQLLVISQRRATARENKAFDSRAAAFAWLGKQDPAR